MAELPADNTRQFGDQDMKDEEQPAAEQPAAEQPAAEQPAAEQPADELLDYPESENDGEKLDDGNDGEKLDDGNDGEKLDDGNDGEKLDDGNDGEKLDVNKICKKYGCKLINDGKALLFVYNTLFPSRGKRHQLSKDCNKKDLEKDLTSILENGILIYFKHDGYVFDTEFSCDNINFLFRNVKDHLIIHIGGILKVLKAYEISKFQTKTELQSKKAKAERHKGIIDACPKDLEKEIIEFERVKAEATRCTNLLLSKNTRKRKAKDDADKNDKKMKKE